MLLEAFEMALAAHWPQARITRHVLEDMRLLPVDGAALENREALIDARAWDHPLFAPARDFQAADAIVVAAPYWDLMFPAMLKVYVEHVFIRELTFCYRDDQPIGLCRAKRALFLTTAGSPIGDADFGSAYLRATFAMLGIGRFDRIAAEGLDLQGAPVEALLDAARASARACAEGFFA